ncbi:MAG: PQQ-binding-like beta-propeller repeat protein, partial [bacterium]
YVLMCSIGSMVKEMRCGDPNYSAPVVTTDRVYFSTFGSRVYALDFSGNEVWKWDMLLDYKMSPLAFNRWGGKGIRADKYNIFFCTDNIGFYNNKVVLPTGPRLFWLEDKGISAGLSHVLTVPNLGYGLFMSIADNGHVYWERIDHDESFGIFLAIEKLPASVLIPKSNWDGDKGSSRSGSSVSSRGKDIYRCRPQEDFGLSVHKNHGEAEALGGYASISSPILAGDSGIYGGLDGKLYIASLSDKNKVWSFATAFGKSISAPVAVCDGKIYFGCEDGYLYILGPGGSAQLPQTDLELSKIRSPLTGDFTDPKYDWPSPDHDFQNTGSSPDQLQAPFKIKWIRQVKGSVIDPPVCGGGRIYTHLSQGMIIACEQETGRQLWRKYFPGYTSSHAPPLYSNGRLYIADAGIKNCLIRCLDAATGNVIWEAPFTGIGCSSPVIYKNLFIYSFSSFVYKSFSERSSWSADSFPDGREPLVRAWNIETGDSLWETNFSSFNAGGDQSSLCLLGDTLFYSCFFGNAAVPRGVTAALNPNTGDTIWTTSKNSISIYKVLSVESGKLYVASWPWDAACLNTEDGTLLYSLGNTCHNNVVIGKNILYTGRSKETSYILDKSTRQILASPPQVYACTRWIISEPFLLSTSMDIYDLASGKDKTPKLNCGPTLAVHDCEGAVVSNGK